MRWRIGNCVFDSLTRQIISTAEIPLGRPEASVLEILIKHFDERRTDAQLAKEAWETATSPDSLYKSIQNLRQAFGGEREAFIASRPYRLVVKPERIEDDDLVITRQEMEYEKPSYELPQAIIEGGARKQPTQDHELSRCMILTRSQLDDVIGTVEERVQSAKEEIWISGNDNMFVAKALSPSLAAALEAGRKVKLLGVDPDCPAAAMLSIIDPRFSRDPFKGEVDFVSATARRWKDKYDNFEYKLLALLPAVGYFITDPELETKTVKIELYTAQPWEPLASRPHLVIPENLPEWRDYFIQQFKNYWNLSKTPW
jgi:DNA-binding winged helix-turn-helix (wHTH) protein